MMLTNIHNLSTLILLRWLAGDSMSNVLNNAVITGGIPFVVSLIYSLYVIHRKNVSVEKKNEHHHHDRYVRIQELYVYPIKSCKGIAMTQCAVTARGFHLDRIFMVVDKSGKFISQRSYPSMALIEVVMSAEEGKKEAYWGLLLVVTVLSSS